MHSAGAAEALGSGLAASAIPDLIYLTTPLPSDSTDLPSSMPSAALGGRKYASLRGAREGGGSAKIHGLPLLHGRLVATAET